MSLLAAIRGRKLRGLILPVYALLLVFYVAGTSQVEQLHKLMHAHDRAVSHNEAHEKDPCHRAIYHHEIAKGCGHHAHIVVTDKCQFCDLMSHTDQIFLSTSECIHPHFSSADFSFCSSDAIGIVRSILSSRAPPAI